MSVAGLADDDWFGADSGRVDASSPTQLADGVWDVVVFRERSTRYLGPDAIERLPALYPLADVFMIGPDDAGRFIAQACAPLGVGNDALRSTPAHVLLARQVSANHTGENHWTFDRASASDLPWRVVLSDHGAPLEDGPLHRALRLLRLVRANEIGVGTAARIIVSDRRVVSVVPHRVFGPGGTTIIERNPPAGSVGLRLDDLVDFEAVWRAYNGRVLPSRVERALLWHERATWETSGMIRAVLVATAFESLLTFRDNTVGETAQFVLRMQGLIDRGYVDETLWPATRLHRFYDARSVVVHGRFNFRLEDEEELTAIQSAAERSLRELLRLAILDGSASSLFESDQSLHSELPASKNALKAWRHDRRVKVVPSWATC